MAHSASVFTQLALIFVQLAPRLVNLDLGKLDEAKHRVAGIHDHARARSPVVFSRCCTLKLVERGGLLLKLRCLALRIAPIIDGVSTVLPSPIAPGLMLRALCFPVGLRSLTSLLCHFGPALLQKAVKGATHTESIPTGHRIVERRQGLTKALQITDIVVKLRAAPIDLGSVLGTLPAALSLRIHRDETQRNPEKQPQRRAR